MAEMCFYDYLSMIKLYKSKSDILRPNEILLENGEEHSWEWRQEIRRAAHRAMPVLKGELTDIHDEEVHEKFAKGFVCRLGGLEQY